jgi:integrase
MVDIYFIWPDGSPFRYRKVMDFPSAAAARKWGKMREAELRESGKPSPAPANRAIPTFDEFWPRFLDHGIGEGEKPSSTNAKRGIFRVHLSPAFGSLPLDAITDERLSAFRSGLVKRDLAEKTRNNILSPLGACLKLAVKWRVIAAMPCIVEIPAVHSERPEFYDFDDYSRLCEGALKVGTREHALVRLGGDAGLRRGEMIALRWTDVDFRRRQLRVEQAAWQRSRRQVRETGEPEWMIGTPKGGRGRVIPMTDALHEALQAHRRIGVEYVLAQGGGSIAPGHLLRDWLEAAQRRAGMLTLGALHKLRHTFCSHLAMHGAPPKAIQELAGHTDLSQTMRYMHLSPSALDDAIRLLDTKKSSGNGLATQSGSR